MEPSNSKEEKLTSEKFKKVLNEFLTSPFPSDRLDDCIAYFIDFINSIDPEDPVTQKRKFPYSVWVDKKVIQTAFDDNDVDGFRIIPIRYKTPEDIQNTSYKIGDINFAIIFTHKQGDRHVNDPKLLFDYNDPCPKPPCPHS